MRIENIKIKIIAPNKGHIGFASCIIDGWLFLNNIAVFTRLHDEDKIRLVFPEKKIGDKAIAIFYPLSSDHYFLLEQAILNKLKDL